MYELIGCVTGRRKTRHRYKVVSRGGKIKIEICIKP